MLRAVIFDFDGVITDSEILHLHTFNQVLAPYGIEIATRDYYKDYLGLTDFDCFKLLVDKGLLELDVQGIENLIRQKNQTYQELARTEGKIIKGVCDLLQTLKQYNIPMAICSGSLLPEIELILKEAQLESYFEVIVSAEQIRKGKPEPEGFLLTLRKLNEVIGFAKEPQNGDSGKSQSPIAGNQCVVVEDSHWGLEAARAAGMHTIAVTNSYDAEQLALAEKVVDNLSQLSINGLQELCA